MDRAPTNTQSRVLGSSSSSGPAEPPYGNAYEMILDHVLTYPAANEIPLRTMYTLNCVPRAQHASPRQNSPLSSANNSPHTPQSPFADSTNTQSFHENLLAQMSQLSHQPSQLPPSFITSFVQKCFNPELKLVDFSQALTGLDYLKDLEVRRLREYSDANLRLNHSRSALAATGFPTNESHIIQWSQGIQEKALRLETLYTNLYISMRRWILINEMSLEPFSKHNCTAMLNTLFPPVYSVQPTPRLTQDVLKSQRVGYFKYIQQVEKSGTRILANLIRQGKGENDENGWLAVVRTLSLYLQLANSFITDCNEVQSLHDLMAKNETPALETKHSRKADSGISFGSNAERRPSTHSSSAATEPASPAELSWPKPRPAPRSGTTLEKLARGLRTIGRSRTDVTEMVREHVTPPVVPVVEKQNILRKMRSMGSIDMRTASRAGTPVRQLTSTPEHFDSEAMQRQRLKYENSTAAVRLGQARAREI